MCAGNKLNWIETLIKETKDYKGGNKWFRKTQTKTPIGCYNVMLHYSNTTDSLVLPTSLQRDATLLKHDRLTCTANISPTWCYITQTRQTHLYCQHLSNVMLHYSNTTDSLVLPTSLLCDATLLKHDRLTCTANISPMWCYITQTRQTHLYCQHFSNVMLHYSNTTDSLVLPTFLQCDAALLKHNRLTCTANISPMWCYITQTQQTHLYCQHLSNVMLHYSNTTDSLVLPTFLQCDAALLKHNRLTCTANISPTWCYITQTQQTHLYCQHLSYVMLHYSNTTDSLVLPTFLQCDATLLKHDILTCTTNISPISCYITQTQQTHLYCQHLSNVMLHYSNTTDSLVLPTSLQCDATLLKHNRLTCTANISPMWCYITQTQQTHLYCQHLSNVMLHYSNTTDSLVLPTSLQCDATLLKHDRLTCTANISPMWCYITQTQQTHLYCQHLSNVMLHYSNTTDSLVLPTSLQCDATLLKHNRLTCTTNISPMWCYITQTRQTHLYCQHVSNVMLHYSNTTDSLVLPTSLQCDATLLKHDRLTCTANISPMWCYITQTRQTHLYCQHLSNVMLHYSNTTDSLVLPTSLQCDAALLEHNRLTCTTNISPMWCYITQTQQTHLYCQHLSNVMLHYSNTTDSLVLPTSLQCDATLLKHDRLTCTANISPMWCYITQTQQTHLYCQHLSNVMLHYSNTTDSLVLPTFLQCDATLLKHNRLTCTANISPMWCYITQTRHTHLYCQHFSNVMLHYSNTTDSLVLPTSLQCDATLLKHDILTCTANISPMWCYITQTQQTHLYCQHLSNVMLHYSNTTDSLVLPTFLQCDATLLKHNRLTCTANISPMWCYITQTRQTHLYCQHLSNVMLHYSNTTDSLVLPTSLQCDATLLKHDILTCTANISPMWCYITQTRQTHLYYQHLSNVMLHYSNTIIIIIIIIKVFI